MQINFPSGISSFLIALFFSSGLAWPQPDQKIPPLELKAKALLLQNSGDLPAATEALKKYLEAYPDDSQALDRLGELFYWQGEPAAAGIRFEEALLLNPGLASARQRLNEIYTMSAPWVRIGFHYQDDNQPLKQIKYPAEAGWPLTPFRSLAVRIKPQVFTFNSSEERAFTLSAVYQDYWPSLRLGTEITAGYLDRSFTDDLEWVGDLELDLRLPQHFLLKGIACRDPYLETIASLTTPVMKESYSSFVIWNPPAGWDGQVGYLWQRYPDDNNAIRTTYVWLLAPLVQSPAYSVMVGYAFGYEDAEESRYVPQDMNNPILRDDDTYSYEGEYYPYYTPHNVLIHSAVAALSIEPVKNLFLSLNGSYGFYATEDAPYLYPGEPGTFERGFYKRWFHPWKAEGNLKISLLQDLLLIARFEHTDKPYFRTNYASLSIVLRFPTSLRKATP